MTQVTKHYAADLPSHAAIWLQRHSLLGSVPFATLWQTLGGEPVYWSWYEGETLVALLPGIQFGRGRLARLQIMPDGLYGQMFFLEGATDKPAVTTSILKAISAEPFGKVYLNDYYSQFDTVPGFEAQECRTSLVDITPHDWQPPDHKLQSEIRKALRENIAVRDFSLNRHLDAFLELMVHTEQRHGRRPKYSDEFYHALGRLAMSDTRVRWLVCEHDGALAASHIYFVESDMLLNWQVFFDKRFSALKPNQLMTYTIARELGSRGVRFLNLGSTPESAESLSYYKDKWGGEEYRYHTWSRRSWLGRLL